MDLGNHNNGFIGVGGYGFGGASSSASAAAVTGGVAGSGGGRDYLTGSSGHQLTMHRQWYDEPLYANDTDEFYMFGRDGPGAGAGGGVGGQGRRMSATNRREQRNGVISLRSAGDISLPQNGNCRRTGGGGRQMSGNQHKFQGNGDYSGSVSDIQSVTSRMSSVSVSGRVIATKRRKKCL